MKLQTKLTLFSSLFMFFIIVIVNAIIYMMFYKISTDNELVQLSDQTDVIVETLQENPEIPRENLLQAFLPTNGMIRIVDQQNKATISTLTKQEEYRKLPATFSNQEVKQVQKDGDGNYIAVVLKPIISENGEVVTLQVANYLISLKESMRILLYVLIAASLFILIPSIIGSNILGRFVLRPIRDLVLTMQENMREEKWKKITITTRSQDELYEMEKTFNDMIDHLKANFQKQEAFVSNASHELKTPIAIMKGYSQLLKRRGNTHPEVIDESIDAIDSEADRMENLVEQMLLLARRNEGLEIAELDIVALTAKVIATFRKAYEREILFHSQVPTILVRVNKNHIEQVLYILLDNAIKYSEKEIKVLLFVQDSFAFMQISDLGKGISKEDQEHIFDRFYRVDKARTRSTGGTGLGLSIAKEMMAINHGNLTVQSVENEGTTFTVQIPKMT